jgi:ABC-2 type transport system permease protein
MTLLILIFSSFENPENQNFRVVLFRNPGKNVEMIEDALRKVSSSQDSSESLFSLEVKTLRGNGAGLKEDMEKLKESKIHAVVVIPDDFDAGFEKWILSTRTGVPSDRPEIKTYFLNERATSRISAEVIKSIVKHINNSLARFANISITSYEVDEQFVGARSFRYRDYLFPSTIIFSFFATALFGMAQEVVEFRSKGILKRLHLTSLSSSELFVSFNASRISLMVIQFLLVSFLALLVFKVDINPFGSAVLSYSALSAVTFMSLAFMIASVIANTQQATVVSNLVIQVFQFLGGLYFNVFNIPWFLRWIVYVNPLTYLVSGMRQELGIVTAPYPYYLSYTVPLIWIAVSVTIAGRYFRWVEEQ